jgi:hypothetical protein
MLLKIPPKLDIIRRHGIGESWSVVMAAYNIGLFTIYDTRVYPKYFGLVPPYIQQLWQREAPVDGRTTMSSESVCQVARSWVEVGSFHTCLVVRFMIFTASVWNILGTPSYRETEGPITVVCGIKWKCEGSSKVTLWNNLKHNWKRCFILKENPWQVLW